MSYFISFEGGEGTGKSTQIKILKERICKTSNYQCLIIQEPGTTNLGDKLRVLLKKETSPDHSITYLSELLLFSAARSELVTKVIKPNLEKPNLIIIADRYVDSTTAYQGFGRKLELNQIELINKIATHMIYPDLTFLLDSDPEIMFQRIIPKSETNLPSNLNTRMRKDIKGTRKFEEEPIEFHKRVRTGYLKILKSSSERMVKINANQDKGIISDLIWQKIRNNIPNLK